MNFKFITTFLISAMILVACSGKINMDNYNKISNGMTVEEVEQILGEGESNASSNFDLGEYGGTISSEVMTWQSGTKVITITFTNGRVEFKAQAGL